MLEVPIVLIVDDEPANRRLLRDMLVREGCQALLASGGAEALALLDTSAVDLVLLDLMMPEVDGTRVLAELRSRGRLPELPVIVVTAHDDRKLRGQSLKSGAVDFLTKPIDRMEVTTKVRTQLQIRELRERAVSSMLDRLVESDHLVRLRFEQSPVASMTWSPEGKVSEWNPAAEKLFGYRIEEALGKEVSMLASAEGEGALVEALAKAQAEPAMWTAEVRTKDGESVTCEWHCAPLTSADGTHMGVTSVVLDTTERSRLQGALSQAQKMDAVGQLAGGIAHDFNNILGVILSYGSFLRESLDADDPRRGDVQEILGASERAASLTKQLLAFARQQTAARRPTDLNDSLRQLQKLLMRTIGSHVTLSVEEADRPCVVVIDPVQFDQIVLNLAVNARDAMPDGGSLLIALDRVSEGEGPDQVLLKVTDTGMGMSSELQKRIFEPFFTTKEQGKGTGLGLATCMNIVTEAGGTLDVRSVLQQGTTFTISFPATDQAAENASVAATPPPKQHGRQVLLVDDNPELRRVSARVLEGAGYTVHTASDGLEGIRRLDELGPELDVVLSDVVMPGCGGHEVVQHAQRAAPQAGVLLMSGFLDEAARRHERQDFKLLWKPIAPNDLLHAVAAVLPEKAPAPSEQAVAWVSASANSVLVVEDDEATRAAMGRLLEATDFEPTLVGTTEEAKAALTESPPAFMLCDLTLADGPAAPLLDWVQENLPGLCPRTLILTGGACDAEGERVTTSGVFKVLKKPFRPDQLLEALEGYMNADAAVEVPAKPETPPPSAPAPRGAPPATLLSKHPARPSVAPGRERVLIVDDDDALVGACERCLLDASFSVRSARTLAEARKRLADETFDVVLVDLGLPDGNGLELQPELRGHNAEVPMVIMTGTLSAESAARALRGRVEGYLAKPFLPGDMVRTLGEAAAAGRIARVRTKLLAARFGGHDFVQDIDGTARQFMQAIPKIRMVYQPILRARDRSVFGYEALLRCDEPALASPVRLLAAAEVLGRVDDVGRAVRASVADTIMTLMPSQDEAIFVNLHPAEVRADLLAEDDCPLKPVAHRVIFEVTERASLEAGPKLDDEITRIRQLGYRFAVDDLGEGYAGLSSLVHLRPDIAKIDMSLVRDIDSMRLKREIVAALVDMARRSGISVVAEGVETLAECETLLKLGCDLLQGYLFAKPGPPFPEPRRTFRDAP